ncbi:MAG: RNA polymerase sigma factor FliA [Legionella sp.]|nr:RNA polymerase sigma factor FliA [Legionella sp.]
MDALSGISKVNQQNQEMMVKGHLSLVKRIAYHLLGRLPQNVQLDDLIQAGMIGLLEAANHYDASKGASFETYAGIRIKGNILDEIRANDWVPRSVYRNARMISAAVRKLEHELGRAAKDCEIACELKVPLTKYHEMLQDSASSHLYGFDDLGMTDDTMQGEHQQSATEPHVHVLRTDLVDRLSAVISGLPPKERLVLSLYYEHDLNLKEIGEVIEVGESRVSQILSQAIHRVRARIDLE